jgi:hypothetical protein
LVVLCCCLRAEDSGIRCDAAAASGTLFTCSKSNASYHGIAFGTNPMSNVFAPGAASSTSQRGVVIGALPASVPSNFVAVNPHSNSFVCSFQQWDTGAAMSISG